jgi:hypothetical protein
MAIMNFYPGKRQITTSNHRLHTPTLYTQPEQVSNQQKLGIVYS